MHGKPEATAERRQFVVKRQESEKTSCAANCADAVVAGSNGKLLKRSEAARMLGVSVSTLRRREGELLNPIVSERGVHYFEESEVRSVLVQRRSIRVTNGVDNGGMAADVFELLDREVHPVDIVKQLRLPPTTVRTLQAQWAEMRGGFVVSAEEARRLSELAGHCEAQSAAALEAQLRQQRSQTRALLSQRHGPSPVCRLCGTRPSCVCEPCLVEHRGPLVGSRIRLERRATDGGPGKVRIVADVMWDDTPFEPGARSLVAMASDWYPSDSASIDGFLLALGEKP